MVNAVTLKDGRVHFNNYYVRTPKYGNETAPQKILYRGVDTQIPGGMLRICSGHRAMQKIPVAFSTVASCARYGRGKPWELDPSNLHSVGEYTFDGGLCSMQPFSAHARSDPRTGYLYNFGVFGVPKPTLHFYKIDPVGNLVSNQSHYVGDYSMCHDFLTVKNHTVFVLYPAFMRSPIKFFRGMNSIFESIEFDGSEKTKIMVLDLETSDIVREFEFDSFFGFHHGNTSEQGDEITMDVLCADDMDVMGGLADVFMDGGDDFDFLNNGAVFNRFTLNLATGESTRGPVAGSIACLN